VPLKPNDFIYIADADEATIIVMGEVNFPRVIPYTRDYSLVEALSICQGFTREAYQSRVVIIRTTAEGDTKYVEVDVNDLLHGKDIKNLMLKSGDIVYVPEQPISEYARWAGFLSQLADLVLKGYQVRETIMFPKLNRNDTKYSSTF
jgi:protein involved in polysaccharide export with SLBB domain